MPGLKKIPVASAAAILARYAAPAELRDRLDPGGSPAQALEALAKAGSLADYAGFLAHALPPREAISWGTACLRAAECPGHRDRDAAEMAAAWVTDPTEARRGACGGAAAEIGTNCAAGWLALAVWWNGSGSIGPEGQPALMPAPYLHAKALVGAVALSGGADGRAQARFLRRAHALGLDVARGGWPHRQGAGAA